MRQGRLKGVARPSTKDLPTNFPKSHSNNATTCRHRLELCVRGGLSQQITSVSCLMSARSHVRQLAVEVLQQYRSDFSQARKQMQRSYAALERQCKREKQREGAHQKIEPKDRGAQFHQLCPPIRQWECAGPCTSGRGRSRPPTQKLECKLAKQERLVSL